MPVTQEAKTGGLCILSSRSAWAIGCNPSQMTNANTCGLSFHNFRSLLLSFMPISLFSFPLFVFFETANSTTGTCFFLRLWRLAPCCMFLGSIKTQCVKTCGPCQLPEHLSHLSSSLSEDFTCVLALCFCLTVLPHQSLVVLGP